MAKAVDEGHGRGEDAGDPRITAAQRGDREAAQSLLRELLPRVRNLVRYLVSGDSDVDDMAQNAMIAILKGLPSYRGEGRIEAWADRITVRETLSYAKRKRKERHDRRDAKPDLRLVQGGIEAPDGYLERRRAVALLDTLPKEQRDVLVLHHVVGLSVPELSRELGIPFETARSRLRLGMRKLRSLHDRGGGLGHGRA